MIFYAIEISQGYSGRHQFVSWTEMSREYLNIWLNLNSFKIMCCLIGCLQLSLLSQPI